MDIKKECWYESWFDSKYYHILYKHRNDSEAAFFIDNILKQLHPNKDARFWDMACGKGRHAVYMNTKGYDVTGTDLSEHSVKYAMGFENEKLRFQKHDMRAVLASNYFDCVFSLFTSFGYFENKNDDLKVFKSAYTGLKSNGMFVLDFMNSAKVTQMLKPYEEKEVDGILFKVSKKVAGGFIVKNIQFSDNGKDYDFYEKVKICSLDYFKELATAVNFKIVNVFGDYSLNEFNVETSDRLILVFQK